MSLGGVQGFVAPLQRFVHAVLCYRLYPMPGFIKKRRGPSGPNKNEQKVARAESAEGEGKRIMGQRLHMIKKLKLAIKFLDVRGNMLDEAVRAFTPLDAAKLAADCPGRCGRGKFDFNPVVAGVVEARQNVSEG